ncbi:MBL fold metallo-hydrolase, partial [bacterium]|nr:MBL fold metallo-hydrolase [bacterium]
LFVGSHDSIRKCREDIGIEDDRLASVQVGEEKRFGHLTVRGLFARDTDDPPTTPHFGYLFEVSGIRIYHVGDTHCDIDRYKEEMEPIRGLAPDAMLVAINKGYNNPGPEGAARLVEMADPRLIVPCHFDCFKNNTIDPQVFVDAAPEAWRDRIHILHPGEKTVISGKPHPTKHSASR